LIRHRIATTGGARIYPDASTRVLISTGRLSSAGRLSRNATV